MLGFIYAWQKNGWTKEHCKHFASKIVRERDTLSDGKSCVFFSALTSFYSRASFSGYKCILMWFGLCRERGSCLAAFFFCSCHVTVCMWQWPLFKTLFISNLLAKIEEHEWISHITLCFQTHVFEWFFFGFFYWIWRRIFNIFYKQNYKFNSISFHIVSNVALPQCEGIFA